LKQAEIWLADLEPAKGSEQGKTRPIVIISGNEMNINFSVVIACPFSSVVKNYEGCVIIPKAKSNGLQIDSEIITFQIRTISKERLLKKIGVITNAQLTTVINGLNNILTL
jgi:mRNA interferase MazF